MNFTSTRPKAYDQPIFVAAEIKDNSVVADEIDGTAELPLYFGRVGPMRLGCNREPRPNWAFGMRVTRPKLSQSAKGDHLHGETVSCHQFGDNPRPLPR